MGMLYSMIVVYNIGIDESPAFQSLRISQERIDTTRPHLSIRYVIVDNSSDMRIAQYNHELCSRVGVDYIGMGGNYGLPAAYRKGIAYASGTGADYILVSDQDSSYDAAYLQTLLMAIEQYPEVDVFVPRVIAERSGEVISPSVRRGRTYYVNAGMTVAARVYELVQYDPALFLDYVDYDFCHSCYQSGIEIRYIDMLRIRQDFSGAAKRGLDADYRRFEIYVRDGRYYYRKWYGRSRNLEQWIRCLHLCMMYRSLRFVAVMFSE